MVYIVASTRGIEPRSTRVNGPPHSPEMLGAQLVGVTGFEPATPASQAQCATKLRYTPMTVVVILP